MTFYLESQHLDLSKKYFNFEYESLTGQSAPKLNIANLEVDIQGENLTEGINQNQYLLLQENDLILHDLSNIIHYISTYKFNPKYLNPQTLEPTPDEESKKIETKFPFQQIKNRLCFIFQKYQEQPALLEPVLEPVVQAIMGTC